MTFMLDLASFDYPLSEQKIARYPLNNRADAKLLAYCDGEIEDTQFGEIGHCLPLNSLLVCNNTKVIPARLFFTKPTGANIEIFLTKEVSTQGSCSVWECLIGNAAKWPYGTTLQAEKNGIRFWAERIEKTSDRVSFHWLPHSLSFSQILDVFGQVPLPPYLKRKAEAQDKQSYQSVFAAREGAVAAPTAALHFTPEMMDKLQQNNQRFTFLTLHVSAGTFLPVKGDDIAGHIMHSEKLSIGRQAIVDMLHHKGAVVAVGTTVARTLESIYWFAHALQQGEHPFVIPQLAPSSFGKNNLSRNEALEIVLDFMDRHKLQEISGETSIFIYPPYRCGMFDALITNFHQPKSTLLLLVVACIGADWRKVYGHALKNNYRFLSYGDTSLLINPSAQSH